MKRLSAKHAVKCNRGGAETQRKARSHDSKVDLLRGFFSANSAPPRFLFLFAIFFVASSIVRAEPAPVAVTETADTYTLANGIVTAIIDKHSGGLMSLVYNKLEMLNPGRHDASYWSHSAASDQMIQKITIDPSSNNGAIGEVSVKGIAERHIMHGAGAGRVGDRGISEIRYAAAAA